MTRSRISFLALIFTGLFITALMVPARAIAVPASPDVHVLEQPDGATFNALQWGDENRHGWETDDGYTIVFEEKMNRWTYARHDFNGNLVGTAYIAGKDLPPFDMPKNLRPARKPAVTMMTSKEWALAAPSLSPSLGAPAPQGIGGPQLLVPSTGTGNIPVVLVNFSDRTTTYTPAQFNNLIFGAGDYSMMGYYDEVSYGLFEIAPGPSSLAQWYAASGTHNYYGGSQTLWATLAKDTAQLAGAAGFDFTAYDTDGDCKVDVLAVIHQGPGQEATGNINDVWSHRWSLSGAGIGAYDTGQTCAADNAQHVIVDDYIIMPEKYGTGMSTMGVFAHEYGHSFGLPDLYDTDYTSEGVGKWSLMAAGSWNYVTRPGDRPAHMDAWCKYFLGWVNPTLVTSPLFYEPVTAAETTPDVYQFLSGSPTGGGEYFLVENRQKIGFDAGLPGSGLLIWHIDESQPSNDCAIFPFYYGGFWYWFDESTYLGNPDCTPSSHYHVALVQADNRYQLEGGNCYTSGGYLYCSGNIGDAGDPFPGSKNKRIFSGASNVYNNSNLYNGSASNVIVTSISNSGTVMTASMAAAVTATTPPLADALDNPTQTDGSTALMFTTGGSGNWTGQDLVALVGGTAAKSPTLLNSQSSFVQTSVTGPASIGFSWKVSSQPTYDYLKFSIDGVEKARISGEKAWQAKGFAIPTGTHTLTWTYVKNGSIASGFDAAWLDNIMVNQYTKVAVTAPNGGEAWAAGSSQNITWNAPAAGAKSKLYYTVNNGTTWKLIASDVTGNAYSWSVPAMNGNKKACKVKVTAYSATGVLVGSDASNAPFTIEVLKVTAPNGGEFLISGAPGSIDYTLNSTATAVASTVFYYTTDGGVTWKLIGADTTNTAPGAYNYSWTVPAVTAIKTKCKIKVVIKSASGSILGTDTSDAFFRINLT